MIEARLLRDKGILVVSPVDALKASDFAQLRLLADPYIDEHGGLNGLLIKAESFPGWEDFSGMLSHFRFLYGYEKRVKRVAAVTDSSVLAILPKVADYFAAAEVRRFNADDEKAALAWLCSGGTSL